MDKNAIKKYAVWARRELISRVSQKALQYGISENEYADKNAESVNGKLLTAEEKHQRAALIDQINKNGYQQVMEEVAYTWFNRFCALRFMEVNGYLPTHVRVFSDEENNFKPQILTEAMNLNLPGLKLDKVYELKNDSKEEELFKYLLIVQCNALNSILPGMFQKISDYTELLFPDNLLREGSVIQQMIELIPEEDWKDAVQIIGWLYQFYNIEPKAAVFAKNGKVTKEEIPAATQLFTPDWIVRYMVENSLGRLWIEGHPNEELKAGWKYYLDEAEQEEAVQAQLVSIRSEYANVKPEEIKVIDPCMGSGHILCYMFDVLVQIYEAYGYSSRDAAASIVQNNIYGLDIDDRASQLAYFAVMMKALQYDRRFLTRGINPNVYSITESNGISCDVVDYFVNGDEKLEKEIQIILGEMRDAKEYGSIINISNVNFDLFYSRFDEIFDDVSLLRQGTLDELLPLVKVANILSQKYHVAITNPPYMPVSNMSPKVDAFVKKNYPDSKTDLFAVFIEKCGNMLIKNGMQAMITMHSWMFLSSYEKLRGKLQFTDIINMAHLGARAFEEIGGEVVQTTSFVMRKSHITDYKGTYCRLIEPNTQQGKEDRFLANENRYHVSKSKFSKLPGIPVAYWISTAMERAFENGEKITKYIDTFLGIITGDNDKFLRLWSEVIADAIPFHADKMNNINLQKQYWIPYNKGGEFRRWYGIQDYVINWRNGPDDKRRGKRDYCRYYLSDYVAWSYTVSTSTKTIATRYYPNGFLWDVRGSGIFDKTNMLYYLAALISSRVGYALFRVKSEVLSCQVENIAEIPILYDKNKHEIINSIVNDCVSLSKTDWDSFETSWDFKKHPLI